MSPTTPVKILPQRRTLQLELFELAPDVLVAAKPVQITAPRMGIVTWVPVGDGLYKSVIETHPTIIDIKDWDKKTLGCSKFVIAVLCEAGYVEAERLSPRTLAINLESYFAHRAKVREDHFFWLDDENRRRYSAAVEVVNRMTNKGSKRGDRAKSASSHDTPLFAVNTHETAQTPRRGTAKSQNGPVNTDSNT